MSPRPEWSLAARRRGHAARAAVASMALATTMSFVFRAGPAIAADAAPEGPTLVLLLAVDQLGRDRLDPALPGGLGRLAREGRRFENGIVDHASSSTCPGHASLATGRHPARVGVPGNRFVDRASSEVTYCVDDPSGDGAVLGDEEVGRSPILLRTDALGDWLKAARPESRVYSVSGKDRAAITLGGRRPDGAWWYWKGDPPRFTSSRYYTDRTPEWVEAFNREWRESLPDHWRLPPDLVAADGRPEDFHAESSRYGGGASKRVVEGDADELAERLYHTPFLDEATLDFARELVARHDLGRGPGVDLLAVSLSSTDTVGHLYGPESHEARDSLLRTDAAVGRFLAYLEERAGPGGLVVSLSSDHGVLPLPEWLAATGRSECPVEGGRVGLIWLGLRLLSRLHFEFSPWSWPGQWLHFAGYDATVDRQRAAAKGVDVDEVAAFAEEWIERHPAVAEVWTRREIAEGDDEWARLYRNSADPERGGDLVIQVQPTCLIYPFDEGTDHGTPYLYDREVPIVFFGPEVEPGAVGGPARTIDVAPTLARELGIPVPDDLDGRVLPLR